MVPESNSIDFSTILIQKLNKFDGSIPDTFSISRKNLSCANALSHCLKNAPVKRYNTDIISGTTKKDDDIAILGNKRMKNALVKKKHKTQLTILKPRNPLHQQENDKNRFEPQSRLSLVSLSTASSFRYPLPITLANTLGDITRNDQNYSSSVKSRLSSPSQNSTAKAIWNPYQYSIKERGNNCNLSLLPVEYETTKNKVCLTKYPVVHLEPYGKAQDFRKYNELSRKVNTSQSYTSKNWSFFLAKKGSKHQHQYNSMNSLACPVKMEDNNSKIDLGKSHIKRLPLNKNILMKWNGLALYGKISVPIKLPLSMNRKKTMQRKTLPSEMKTLSTVLILCGFSLACHPRHDNSTATGSSLLREAFLRLQLHCVMSRVNSPIQKPNVLCHTPFRASQKKNIRRAKLLTNFRCLKFMDRLKQRTRKFNWTRHQRFNITVNTVKKEKVISQRRLLCSHEKEEFLHKIEKLCLYIEDLSSYILRWHSKPKDTSRESLNPLAFSQHDSSAEYLPILGHQESPFLRIDQGMFDLQAELMETTKQCTLTKIQLECLQKECIQHILEQREVLENMKKKNTILSSGNEKLQKSLKRLRKQLYDLRLQFRFSISHQKKCRNKAKLKMERNITLYQQGPGCRKASTESVPDVLAVIETLSKAKLGFQECIKRAFGFVVNVPNTISIGYRSFNRTPVSCLCSIWSTRASPVQDLGDISRTDYSARTSLIQKSFSEKSKDSETLNANQITGSARNTESPYHKRHSGCKLIADSKPPYLDKDFLLLPKAHHCQKSKEVEDSLELSTPLTLSDSTKVTESSNNSFGRFSRVPLFSSSQGVSRKFRAHNKNRNQLSRFSPTLMFNSIYQNALTIPRKHYVFFPSIKLRRQGVRRLVETASHKNNLRKHGSSKLPYKKLDHPRYGGKHNLMNTEQKELFDQKKLCLYHTEEGFKTSPLKPIPQILESTLDHDLEKHQRHLEHELRKYSCQCQLGFIELYQQNQRLQHILQQLEILKSREAYLSLEDKCLVSQLHDSLMACRWVIDTTYNSREEAAKKRFKVLLDLKKLEARNSCS